MDEKKELNVEQTPVASNLDTAQDYIEKIKELKKNTVSKEDYDKIREENRQLLQSLVEGNPLQEQPAEEKKMTADELRKALFQPERELNNLEYCKLAVELRDAVLEEEGKDIFVADNSQYTPGQDSYDAAERVASVMKDCIEYAQGDSVAFTNELMRRTNDVNLPRRK